MTHYSNTNNPIDFPKKKEIPMLERFAAQSLVDHGGELIFSKEKFAELIVQECARVADQWVDDEDNGHNLVSERLRQHFGVEECTN